MERRMVLGPEVITLLISSRLLRLCAYTLGCALSAPPLPRLPYAFAPSSSVCAKSRLTHTYDSHLLLTHTDVKPFHLLRHLLPCASF
jgi:hypothetical protein